MKTHYKQFQRYLRQNMPRPEIIIWQSICQKQLGVKFRRQYTIGNRIVDFYAPQIKLAIEIDGDSHFESDTSRKKEIENDNQLKKEGITVIRFLNSDVMKNLDGVLGHIRTCLDPHLNPPPQEREVYSGFSLIEVILALAIFGLLAASILGMVSGNYTTNFGAKDFLQATAYAQEGIDAATAIRRQAFNLLNNGNYGLTKVNNFWEFNGASDTRDDYTRVVTIGDIYRDGTGAIVDSGAPGANLDITSKQIDSVVTWTSIFGTTNDITLTTILTNWQSADWVQTDWVGGSGQSIWSDATKYFSDDGNIDVSTAGEIKLATSGGGGGNECGLKSWDFDAAGNYTFDPEIEVVSSNAQLVGTPGGGGSGGTTDANFSANPSDWTFSSWGVNGPETASTGQIQPAGGAGDNLHWAEITIPPNTKRRELGGFFEQAFTTTVNNPDAATCSFNWQATSAFAGANILRMTVFLDNFSGEPSPGATGIWTQDFTTTSSWQPSAVSIDCAGNLTAAGTYYFKVAVWLENSNNQDNTTITVGYDNAEVQWSKADTITYPTTIPDIFPNSPYTPTTVDQWQSFSETATKPAGTEIYYQLSDDNGISWLFYDEGIGQWVSPTGASDYNTASVLSNNISTFPTANGSIKFRAFLASDGDSQVQLDEVVIGCAQSAIWDFDVDTNYNFDPLSIEVVSSHAQLVGSPGGGGTGQTSDPDFDIPDWTGINWDVNGPETAPTISQSSGGNPGNYGEILIPPNTKRRSLGGLWQQSFVTNVSNPDSATCEFDWQVFEADPGVQASRIEIFIDTFAGEPAAGATGIWSQTFTSPNGGWASKTFDCTSFLTSAGTYYFKLGLWLENSNNQDNTNIRVGFDNARVFWDKAGTVTYPTNGPGIDPTNPFTGTIENWFSFTETATKPVGTEIFYILHDGTNWQYWDGGAWATSPDETDYNFANVAAEIDSNITTFSTAGNQINFRAFLVSNSTDQVQLDRVTVSSGELVGSSGYALFGTLESSTFDTNSLSAFSTIQWTEILPTANEDIQVQISTAPDSGGSPGTWTSWSGLTGAGTYFTDPALTLIPLANGHNDDQWVRYRVELTGDGNDTPVLQDLTINYTP